MAKALGYSTGQQDAWSKQIVCSPGLWTRYRHLAREAPALLIRGTLQNANTTRGVNADKLAALDLRVVHQSRDFR